MIPRCDSEFPARTSRASGQQAVGRWPEKPVVWNRWGTCVRFCWEELVWVAGEREEVGEKA
jgi:hypothetical protein